MQSNGSKIETWRESNRRKLARRALERQLAYQERKALEVCGREDEVLRAMERSSRRVRDLLESFQTIESEARVLEVGSGSHGLIFTFGARHSVGVDPLAVSYATLFPHWQTKVPTVAAAGESLPFPDQSFGIVLCDNVVDHAESPARIASEMVRVLTPGGLLYFTVNIHHAIYWAAAEVHSMWRAISVPFEIGPFADHTIHLTLSTARHLFQNLPIRVLKETWSIADAKARARKTPPRHLGDRLKRVFFKNAVFEVVARRQ